MKNGIKLLRALGNIDDKYLCEENEKIKKEKILKTTEIRSNMSNLKLKYILAPTFILVIIIASFMIFNNINLINQQQLIGKEDSIFDVFTLKVYAAEVENTYLTANYSKEIEEKILNPEVELLLANYSPLMSSVPGLPFKIELNNANNLIDEILITTDTGEILTLDQEKGEVQTKGKIISLNDTKTLYWSPNFERKENDTTSYEQNIWKKSDVKTIGKINILAKKKNDILYEQIVYIGEANHNYYAILYKNN